LHNFIKKLPILSLVLLLASCGAGVQVDNIDKSYETETVMVDAKIPRLSGLDSESLEEAINGEYEKTITSLLSDFKKQASKTGDQSTFMVTTTEHCNMDGIFSAVTQIDSFASESHKNSFRITKNIDTKKCMELMLSDLFSGEEYIDMINASLEDAVSENSERYQGLWEKPRLSENQDFYITPDHLVVYYLPYKLSYYERGFVEIPLSLSDMSGYLKEEYRHLADSK